MSDCLFHRWRLDCCHSTRKPINVTKPFARHWRGLCQFTCRQRLRRRLYLSQRQAGSCAVVNAGINVLPALVADFTSDGFRKLVDTKYNRCF